jgi:hypothetical protein
VHNFREINKVHIFSPRSQVHIFSCDQKCIFFREIKSAYYFVGSKVHIFSPRSQVHFFTPAPLEANRLAPVDSRKSGLRGRAAGASRLAPCGPRTRAPARGTHRDSLGRCRDSLGRCRDSLGRCRDSLGRCRDSLGRCRGSRAGFSAHKPLLRVEKPHSLLLARVQIWTS